MSYRADFWIKSVVSFFMSMTVSYFLWLAVFEHTKSTEISGYSFDQMITYYFFAIMISKVVTGHELGGTMAKEIYEGQYSRYIIYPINFLKFKYAQFIGAHFPMLIQCLLFAFFLPKILSISSLSHINIKILFMGAFAIFISNLIHFLILYVIEAVAFWADNIWSLIIMARIINGFLGGLILPLETFPFWAQNVLYYLPFKYLFYFPTKIFLGKIDFSAFLQGSVISLIWCLILLALGNFMWKRGNYHYTGVGI